MDETCVAIYCRISLDRKDESESTERQEALCLQLAASRGWTVSEVYIDKDRSAYKKVARPALERMWKGLEDGRFATLVVWKLDRLTRHYIEGGKILARLQEHGVPLVSVTEQLDTSTPMGQAIVGFQVAQAEQESRNTSTRVAAAWQAAAVKGKPHIGGKRSFGYTRQYDVFPEEADIVREAVTRLLDGESLRKVAADLNERGSLTTADKPWSAHGLRQCLRSPALAGMRTHHGVKTAGTWEPIITPEQHETLLVRMGAVGPSGEKAAVKWLLSGLVRCARCGERMGVVHQKHYGCQKRPETNGCGKVFITVPGLDKYVTDRLLTFLSNAEIEPLPQDQDPAVLRSSIKADEQRLERLNRARWVDESIGPDEWQPARDELVNRLQASKDALTVLEHRSTLRPGTREELDAWWDGATIEERRAAMRDAFEWIRISPATRRGPAFDTNRVELKWSGVVDRVLEKAGVDGVLVTEDGEVIEIGPFQSAS